MKEELRKNLLWIVIAFLVGFVVFLLGERNNSRLYQNMLNQNQQLLLLKARTEQALINNPEPTKKFFRDLGYNIRVSVVEPQKEVTK